MYFLYIIVHAEYLVLHWYEDVTLTSFNTIFCLFETINSYPNINVYYLLLLA
jgi:hypothetical protein